MSLTQYLESQEDQDTTSLEIKRGEVRVFPCLGMEEMWVYIVMVEKL